MTRTATPVRPAKKAATKKAATKTPVKKAATKSPAKRAAAKSPARNAATKKAAKSPGKKAARKSAEPAVELIAVEVDERTLDMTMEALECRAANHPWARVPQGTDRRALLAAQGQAETVRVCTRCASTKTETYWLPSFAYAMKPVYQWSEGYRIATRFAGQGRLTRQEVRKAMFVRENQDLFTLVA